MTATLRRDLDLIELRSLYPYSFAAHDWLLERSVDLANVLWLYAREGLPHELLGALLKTFGDERAKEVGEDTHLVTEPRRWDEGIYVPGFSLACSAPLCAAVCAIISRGEPEAMSTPALA